MHMMIFCPKCGLIPFTTTWTVTQCWFSRHKYGLRSEWCQIQRCRTDTKILVTANDLHTNQDQKTLLSHTYYCAMCKQFLLCALRKAPWQHICITSQFKFRISCSMRSLDGRNLFPAFSAIKESTESETQSQLYVCCTLEQKDKPSTQSSLCATQFNGSSVSVMCLQTKYHPLLTSASLLLPPHPRRESW